MAPKTAKKRSPPSDPHGMFAGMVVLLVEKGVQPRRLQIWKQKLAQMGASIEDRLSRKVTHVFAMNSEALLQQIGRQRLSRFKGSILLYQWLEDSLSLGEKASEAPYILTLESGRGALNKSSEDNGSKAASGYNSSDDTKSHHKKIRTAPKDPNAAASEETDNVVNSFVYNSGTAVSDSDELSPIPSPVNRNHTSPGALTKSVALSDTYLPYSPPDQNRNTNEIFGKLMNIYRALGDDRRSFSYYKAIAVIEKLPFKIESLDQVKHLPAIGKSMQDHIQEIVSTRKLSKLEHFETDEKVRTISLFGEVWGIGPATALKLYEKGYRTLDDLKNEDSLTNAQRFKRWNLCYRKLQKKFCLGWWLYVEDHTDGAKILVGIWTL